MQHFPQHVIEYGSNLWRIHGKARSPWFFRADGTFRFDLCDRPGFGTCYFAEAPLGAFVEALQSFRSVSLPRGELAARRLFRLPVAHAVVVADVTAPQAGSFGVDASIGAGRRGDYSESQSLATKIFDAGFAGIRYFVRNDPSQTLRGVALFGPAGPHDDLLDGNDLPIEEALVARACAEQSFRTRGPLLDPHA